MNTSATHKQQHDSSNPPEPMAPLLKWPGGKRLLAKSLSAYLPRRWNRYYEPFLGGGALFFALAPSAATLSDANSALIETYAEIRDNPQGVVGALRKMHNSEREYYRIRSRVPEKANERAARFIYLCALAFNGIHRYNLEGKFNVPYGFKTHIEVCDEERIRAASERLRGASLVAADFEVVAQGAKAGDLIYFDPPYTVAHNNNGFVKYNASIFSWADQQRLARAAEAARQKGCSVMVSNANHCCIRDLYQKFNVATIKRHSIIASSGRFRRPITECVFWHKAPVGQGTSGR